MADPHIGPTGKHEFGKSGPDDEGSLMLAVMADEDANLVTMHFGTHLSWFAMTPEQATNISKALEDAVAALALANAEIKGPSN